MKARQIIREIEECLDKIGESDADILIYSEGLSDKQRVFTTRFPGETEEFIVIHQLDKEK